MSVFCKCQTITSNIWQPITGFPDLRSRSYFTHRQFPLTRLPVDQVTSRLCASGRNVIDFHKHQKSFNTPSTNRLKL